MTLDIDARSCLAMVDEYAAEARAAGTAFVEIQSTMRFATLGERSE